MGSVFARLRVCLLAGALAAAVMGTARGAPPAQFVGKDRLGGLVAAQTVGAAESALAPEAETDADETAVNPQAENGTNSRAEYVKRGERRRLIAVIVFLAIVLGALLFWWGWGKIHHRAPRL